MKQGLGFVMLLGLGLLLAHAADDDHHQSLDASSDQPAHSVKSTTPEPSGHEHDHDEAHSSHVEKDQHAQDGIELTEAQRRTVGVETVEVQLRTVRRLISAPGEVVLNAYRTTKVTPRISAQVTGRMARLGDRIKEGQPLVKLSSVEMAAAQGLLVEADIEWKRVEKLGRQLASEKRYFAAQLALQQASARVQAYGMTTSQIDALLKTGDVSQATGEFKLLASQNGTAITDEFIVGDLIEPGRILFTITDESVLWVEARLSADEAYDVTSGSTAVIQAGEMTLTGAVVQISHNLDESTRTLAVRIEVPNTDDRLHPGQFVEARLEGRQTTQAIVVNTEAVLRSVDGDWQVFVETAPGRYQAQKVEVERSTREGTIVKGLEVGRRIVSRGAFFIQSEIAKSGFDAHNH